MSKDRESYEEPEKNTALVIDALIQIDARTRQALLRVIALHSVPVHRIDTGNR